MSLRRQTNVTLPLETAEKMDRFARLFHHGEFAPVARILIEEALTRIRTEEDYLNAMRASFERGELETAERRKEDHGNPRVRKSR